jgi:hypothetical protein
MAALPEPVARELERREPFPDAETKEATAARLLAVWKAMQPKSRDTTIVLRRPRRMQRK